MMDSGTQLHANFSQRCFILSVTAQVVRERATRHGGDLEGWRLSCLMREAETDAQVNFAERKYRDWRQITGTFGPHAS